MIKSGRKRSEWKEKIRMVGKSQKWLKMVQGDMGWLGVVRSGGEWSEMKRNNPGLVP